MPRLLRFEGDARIANSVFADLQLTGLLSGGAVRVMCRPCGKSNVSARQALFARLEEEGFRERVETAYAALRNYRDTLAMRRDAKTAVEACFLNWQVLLAYAKVCDLLAAFSDGGELLGAVASYFGQQTVSEERARLREDCGRLEALLLPLRRLILTIADKNRLSIDAESPSDYEDIAALARGVGLNAPERRKLAFHHDPTLSEGVTALFEAEIRSAKVIFAKYEPLDLSAPTVYIEELSFFLEIFSLAERGRTQGLSVCFPKISNRREYLATDICDPALMLKNSPLVVPNDTFFCEEELFFFVIGANGGGKTTYLRAVATNLIFFLSGCPIFAREAAIYPFSSVLTHFPADERFTNVGRLDEERARVAQMLTAADADTFAVLNETFSGADDERGYVLLLETAENLREKGSFGLFVTHFLQVGNTDFPILTAAVDSADSDKRTYRIVKRKETLSSYAADILKRYGLDGETLSKRRCGNGN